MRNSESVTRMHFSVYARAGERNAARFGHSSRHVNNAPCERRHHRGGDSSGCKGSNGPFEASTRTAVPLALRRAESVLNREYHGIQPMFASRPDRVTRANPAITSSGIDGQASAGDPIAPKCAVIEVHVGELKQLFNSIDPSPFRNKDLDREAEEFIVGWAKDLPGDAQLALVVDLDRQAGLLDEAAVLRDAIHEFFRQRAEAYRRRLRELLRRGRTSLLIGLTVLAAATALGDFLAALMKTSRIGEILRESLTIGGWVSMWRPLEVFLYDWWPIRNEARLFDRLATMPVRIRYTNANSPDAWKADWPVATPVGERSEAERPADAFGAR